MPRLPKKIYDSINGREINNPPEWYDYINEQYTCTTRDAFSGILEVTKTFPKVEMAVDFDIIVNWARDNQFISKANLVNLHKDIMALVKYLSIPQDDRKNLFRMFRISTITKAENSIHEHREALNKVDTNWDQPSLILTLNIKKVKENQAAIREILENKIAYYENNLRRFKENTRNYRYNFELPGLLKPVVEQLTSTGLSKYKTSIIICDLLSEFDIKDIDTFKLRHYI